MALSGSTLALVFNIRGALRKRPQIGTIRVDTHLSEDHSYTSTVTTSEIEDGSPINDHAIDDPFTLTVNGYISNIATLGVGLLGAAIDESEGIAGSSPLTGKNKAKDAERELRFLRSNKVPFSIVTGLRSYKNMLITSLSFPRNSTTGKGLEFNATFQQVNIVKSELLAISEEDQKTLQRTENKGDQKPDPASKELQKLGSELIESGSEGFNQGDAVAGGLTS